MFDPPYVPMLFAQAEQPAQPAAPAAGDAKTEPAGQGAPGGPPAGGDPFPFSMWMPLVVVFVLFYFMILGPQRREQRKREDMLKAMKKDDRVMTSGGIIGSIANISQDGMKVTIKVDENVRIPVHRNYIVSVLTEESKKDGDDAK